MLSKLCKKCDVIKQIDDFHKHKKTLDGRTSYCKECAKISRRSWVANRPFYSVVNTQNNRAKEKGLPATWTYAELEYTLKHFGGCAFTGDTENLSFDHVIPIKAGYGGTVKENMIPIRRDLNSSKGFGELVSWHGWAVGQFKLDPRKLEPLLVWLAAINNMTVSDYKKYIEYDSIAIWDEWRASISASKGSSRVKSVGLFR